MLFRSPVFATVLSDSFIKRKESSSSNPDDISEHSNKYLYDEIKKLVMSKMVKIVDDCKDIKLAIHESLSELKEDYDFEGWARGVSDSTYNNLVEQNSKLVQEVNELKGNKEIILNVSGAVEFMEKLRNSQITLIINEIFQIIAPLIMTPTKSSKVKEDFEQSLKELYMPNNYSLYVEDNQFQKIKALLFSKQLIKLSKDTKDAELIELTSDGTETLIEMQN